MWGRGSGLLFVSMIFTTLFLLGSFALATYQYCPYRDDCLSLPISICVGGGSRVLSAASAPQTLVGWWTFDDRFGHDYSTTNNYMTDVPAAGPAMSKGDVGGKGYSGYYNGTAMSVVPHAEEYEVQEFTIMMWVFLLQDSTGGWRTLLHKGSDLSNLTPSIQLWPKERRLHVRVSTDYFWNEGLDSKALVPVRKWTHIAVIATSQLLELYINGVADTQFILKAAVRVRAR